LIPLPKASVGGCLPQGDARIPPARRYGFEPLPLARHSLEKPSPSYPQSHHLSVWYYLEIMTKYKNISWSLVLYAIAIVWFFAIAKPALYNYPYLTLVNSLLALFGTFLGLKSVKMKEHVAIGYVDVIFGLILTLGSIGLLLLELSPI
jgi:hypothetical protein